jgi:hypothetical protein
MASGALPGLESNGCKGKLVFILDDPDGVLWVMQAFGQLVDKTLTYDGLKDLGSKLKPPAGWKFRVAVLDKDLTISTPQGYNWIVQDELQNIPMMPAKKAPLTSSLDVP